MNSINTRFNHTRRALTAIGALAACLMGAAGSALAAPHADEVATIRVAYGDLNLASDQGNSKLYARISEGLADDFDSVFGQAFARAYQQALDEVRAQAGRKP